MVDHNDLDAVLTACPVCDGLGVKLDRCDHCLSGDRESCAECEGSGHAQALCAPCESTGMVCAQVVITVINMDLATVASAQVVPGAHRPRRLLQGGWGIDCRAIAADLAAQVAAPGLTDVTTPSEEIITLPAEYHPGLPKSDRHELESTAIAQAARRSRWRVRHTAPMTDSTLDVGRLSPPERPGGSGAACGCPPGPRVPAEHPATCPRCQSAPDHGAAPPITLPLGLSPVGTSSPDWTLGHLTQVAFGLGLWLDITCRATDPAGLAWSMSWSSPDAIAERLPPIGVGFSEAVQDAGARLAEVPDRLYSHGEMIPVPSQPLPPVVGLWRVEAALTALATYQALSGDTTVLCRVGARGCSISLSNGRHTTLLAAGADFESAITGLGL